jgi:N-acetylglutamate synthase-like GNAT family acetyltransferase
MCRALAWLVYGEAHIAAKLGAVPRPAPGGKTETHMSNLKIVIRSLSQAGDLGWVVMAHGEVYASEFGCDTGLEVMVAREVASYATRRSPREGGWIAEVDRRRAGCVFCFMGEESTARLRFLLVAPWARNAHVGGRLVDECLDFARRVGYARVQLSTDDPMIAARLYRSRGFTFVEEQPRHKFGVDLTDYFYELNLLHGGETPAGAPIQR